MRTFSIILILVTQTAFAADSPSKYALFVGVAKYKHMALNKPQLEFPEDDAKELSEIFKKSGYTVDLLLGKQATQEAIQAKLKALNDKGDSDGVVVIGLFGHGIEFEATKLACYCPYSTTFRDVADDKGRPRSNDDGTQMIEPDPASLITIADLINALGKSPAGNRILLADCCRNDPNTARGRSFGAFGANLEFKAIPDNTATIFACSSNERAFEHKDWKHGAFTKCLIEEIQSPNASGTVTAGALAERLRPRVKQLVASVSGGRDRQTTNHMVKGFVDLQLSTSTLPAPPPLLVAPFDQKAAQSAQKTLAQSRGINVVSRNSIGDEMVLIPPGEFMMGNDDSVEELQKLFPNEKKKWDEDAKPHKVRITKPFQLGKYEVTIGHFRQFVDAIGYVTDADKGAGSGDFKQKVPVITDFRPNWRDSFRGEKSTNDHPVVSVSWNDAVGFCNWLSRKEGRPEYYRMDGTEVTVVGGKGYRLPTEAEWEYACRAGTVARYYHGSEPEGLIKIGNTRDAHAKTIFPTGENFLKGDDGYAYTSPVGRFSPNAFGLYDMIGNVAEWCGDWYEEYDAKSASDPVGVSSGSGRVHRGGSWGSSAVYCRSADRSSNPPDDLFANLGFRLATTPGE